MNRKVNIKTKPVNHMYEDDVSKKTEAELITYLLGLCKQKSVNEISSKMFKKSSPIQYLLETELSIISLSHNLNKSSLKLLRVIKEVVLRYQRRKYLTDASPKNHAEIIEYCRLVFDGNRKEVFAVFYLDGDWRIIEEEFVSQGMEDKVVCDSKDIVRKALIYRAYGILVVHNHPGGNINPSQSDIKCTAVLRNQLNLFGIQLLDSLILNNKSYFSFAKAGLVLGKEDWGAKYKLHSRERKFYFYSILHMFNAVYKKTSFVNLDKSKFYNKVIAEFENHNLAISEKIIELFLNDKKLINTKSKEAVWLGSKYMNVLLSKAETYFSYLDLEEKFQILSNDYIHLFKCNDKKSLLGRNLEEVIGSVGYNICKPYLKKAFAGNNCSFRYPWHNVEGKLQYVKLHYHPDIDSNKNVRGIAVFLEWLDYREVCDDPSVFSKIAHFLPHYEVSSSLPVDIDFHNIVLSCLDGVIKGKGISIHYHEFSDLVCHTYQKFYVSKEIDLDYVEGVIENLSRTGVIYTDPKIASNYITR